MSLHHIVPALKRSRTVKQAPRISLSAVLLATTIIVLIGIVMHETQSVVTDILRQLETDRF